MTDPLKPCDAPLVRKWLEHRYEASRLDQAAADRRGYEARDDFDKVIAEESACDALKSADCTNDQDARAARLKKLTGQDEYPVTRLHDDIRFEWHVRTYLRKLVKMTKATKASKRPTGIDEGDGGPTT
jgi:hypothetical protein